MLHLCCHFVTRKNGAREKKDEEKKLDRRKSDEKKGKERVMNREEGKRKSNE